MIAFDRRTTDELEPPVDEDEHARDAALEQRDEELAPIGEIELPPGPEPHIIVQARDAGVLLIDDLGAEPAIATSAIAEIIHFRHGAQMPTIVTSGFSVEEIEQRYGSGVLRRLAEHACVVTFRKGATK